MTTLNQIASFFEVTEQLFMLVFTGIIASTTFIGVLFYFDIDLAVGFFDQYSIKFDTKDFYSMLLIQGLVQCFILFCLLLVNLINYKSLSMLFACLKESSISIVRKDPPVLFQAVSRDGSEEATVKSESIPNYRLTITKNLDVSKRELSCFYNSAENSVLAGLQKQKLKSGEPLKPEPKSADPTKKEAKSVEPVKVLVKTVKVNEVEVIPGHGIDNKESLKKEVKSDDPAQQAEATVTPTKAADKETAQKEKDSSPSRKESSDGLLKCD